MGKSISLPYNPFNLLLGLNQIKPWKRIKTPANKRIKSLKSSTTSGMEYIPKETLTKYNPTRRYTKNKVNLGNFIIKKIKHYI